MTLFGTPLGWAAACSIVLVGSLLQGSVGFGLGMLAAPLLVLVHPRLVPAPLLSAAFLLTILIAWREHQSIDFRGLGWAVLGRLPGTVLGALALAAVPHRATAALVAVMVFVAVGLVGSGMHLARTPRTLFGAGTLSGFMGTTTSIGGPAVAILYHDAEGAEMRGTLSSFFIVGLVFSLSALAFVGRFGHDEIRAAVLLFPGVLAGFALSIRVAPALDRGYTRTAVLVASALAGGSLLLQTLLAPA